MLYTAIICTLLFLCRLCSANPEQIYKYQHSKVIPENQECLLAIDVGNTKTSVGVFSANSATHKPVLLINFLCYTDEITNFTALTKLLLDWLDTTYKITIKRACIGAPGFVSENKDWAKPNAMGCEIQAQELKKHTTLEQVIIINDQEIASYGIDALDQDDIIAINPTIKPRTHDTRALIGFGTGLGTALMHWDIAQSCYTPIPFEAGLLEFTPRIPTEQKLAHYLLTSTTPKYKKIIWDSLLSGHRGIITIYEYLLTTPEYEKHETPIKKEELSTYTIFTNRDHDTLCQKAVNYYRYLFTRYLVLFATITQCYGGLYITGGMVQNNVELFCELTYLEKILEQEYPYTKKMVRKIPIYIIKNKHVNLYGAARYLLLHTKNPIHETKSLFELFSSWPFV